MGADTKSNTRVAGAPERGHGASLEALAQLVNALGGVGTLDIAIIHIKVRVEAAELVATQAAKGRRGVSMGADAKAIAWGGCQQRARRCYQRVC